VPAQQLAERGARLLAATIDELILLGIGLPMVFGAVPAVMATLAHANVQSLDTAESLAAVIDPQAVESALFSGPGLIISIVALIAWCVVTAWLVATSSQSIGKRLVGIKVVRTDGSKASFARIVLLRNVVNGLPLLLPYGWLYQLIDPLLIYQPSRQCAHDRIADTVVIRSGPAVTLRTPPA
jgi:uncharacterized RDD family membrane protein YckC